MGEVKFGELKGVDRNGNKYFENTEYPFGQHRWVEYKVGTYGWGGPAMPGWARSSSSPNRSAG